MISPALQAPAAPVRPSHLPALRIVPVSDLLHEDRGWTRGHAHASFDDVPRHVPGYLEFEPILLAAHQTIDAGKGYPLHHHQGVETLTFVIEGLCHHEDSTGQREVIGASSVAVLSAGQGIEHAEFADASGPARCVLFWVRDGDPKGPPRFQTRKVARSERTNAFATLASSLAESANGATAVRQQVKLLAAYVIAGAEVSHELDSQRRAYLLATDAAIRVNGVVAQAGNRVLVSSGGRLCIEALGATEVVLLEV